MKIYDRIIYFLFNKRIEALAKERLKYLAFDRYIEENMDLRNIGKGEVKFTGLRFIRYLASSFHEILEEAENYVSIDLTSGENNMNIIIQRIGPGKMTPHEKAEMYKKKYNDLINDKWV